MNCFDRECRGFPIFHDCGPCNFVYYVLPVCCNRPTDRRDFSGAIEHAGATSATSANGILEFADFYALMPPDNSATVAPGTDVSFPRDGASSGSGIFRTSPSSFQLSEIGSYLVLFQVSVAEAGQLVLTLNGEAIPESVVGRATGTAQLVGISILTTSSADSVLTVRNPAGNFTALTATPLAGGTRSVSAHLTVIRLQGETDEQ